MSSSKSLKDVVNSLTRAAVGNQAASIPDDDLDRFVAELILQEAKIAEKRHQKEGIRAYLPDTGGPPCTLPRTNKRFFLNVLKQTQGYNRALKRSNNRADKSSIQDGSETIYKMEKEHSSYGESSRVTRTRERIDEKSSSSNRNKERMKKGKSKRKYTGEFSSNFSSESDVSSLSETESYKGKKRKKEKKKKRKEKKEK